jgi:hypothetical protein
VKLRERQDLLHLRRYRRCRECRFLADSSHNVIQYGGETRGVVESDKDRDYYKFRTPDQMSGKTRVILRKLSAGGFIAKVGVYDRVENRIARDGASGDDSATLAFDSAANSNYYILVKGFGAGGPYELEVREE